MQALVQLCAAERIYGTEVKTHALKAVDLEIGSGELVVILGPSGSGKTTLLNLIGGLDRPSRGTVTVDGDALQGLSRADLCEFRRQKVGFVFQFFNLIGSLTARENVLFAYQLHPGSTGVDALLEKVGLAEKASSFPSQLSGGEQQRVAFARALAKNPALLLCDEPTGALDQATGRRVLHLLEDSARQDRRTVLIVTHNTALSLMADRCIRLKDGVVVSDTRNPTPVPAEDLEW